MKKYAIIVAGGTGQRMGENLPKQFLALSGKPILLHTLEAFYLYDNSIQIIVTLPAHEIQFWDELCIWNDVYTPHKVVAGGETRFHSVKNGLEHVEANSLVAIHDGVRPFVSREIIDNAYQTAAEKGSAIAAVEVKDSIRRVCDEKNENIDRSTLRAIQTPQTFQSSLIKKAFDIPYTKDITDDASVMEKAGHDVTLIAGSYKNIKITTPEDLLIAEAFLKGK